MAESTCRCWFEEKKPREVSPGRFVCDNCDRPLSRDFVAVMTTQSNLAKRAARVKHDPYS